ncbi:EAL domain-containing protein [Actinoplanes sp. G11-F43]|uniref:EAL domain-containing protein n=1 Tax=Actinoplanes sp. G11-F43 TaxID=3424130 RepID=UPI003D32C186
MQTATGGVWQPGDADIAVVERMLDLVRAHLGLDVAWASTLSADDQTIHVATGEYETMGIPLGRPLDLRNSYCARVLAGILPGTVTDSRVHPIARELASTRDYQIGSYAGVPWRGPDGEVAGMVCGASRQPDPSLGEQSLRYMALIADVISDHMSGPLAQQRHEAALARHTVQAVLDAQSVRMVFQPIVRIKDNDTIGYEALARFEPAVFTGPDKAFAAASKCGLGVPLELLALRQALWRLPDLPPDGWLAVNLSAEALLDPHVRDILLLHAEHRLVVEITEHTQVADYDQLTEALDRLREAGVRLSVDDAGAGFASLQHILKLRPDLIKLDLSLVRGIDSDPVKTALAGSLAGFAAQIGAELVAEGIETAAELERLTEIGVTYGQGYYLGRPAELC